MYQLHRSWKLFYGNTNDGAGGFYFNVSIGSEYIRYDYFHDLYDASPNGCFVMAYNHYGCFLCN